METIHKEYNSQEAQTIVESFLHCNLAKEKYTHAAHILAGFYLYCKFGAAAFELMERHIILFNDSVGTINSDDSGYHKTITFFWMNAIAQYAQRFDSIAFNDRNTQLIYQSPLMDKTIPLNFYTKEYLFSKKARREIVEPDIKPISKIF